MYMLTCVSVYVSVISQYVYWPFTSNDVYDVSRYLYADVYMCMYT